MDTIRMATDSITAVIQVPEDMKLFSAIVICAALLLTRYIIPALNRKPKI